MAIAKVELTGNINPRMARQYRDIFSFVENAHKFKAAIIVINSGGGDAASSEILSNCISKIRKRKPVFAVIEGVGASGAYWIASSSTRIFAMSTSLVGSIGVIGIAPNVKELLDRIGVKVDVVKTGKYKDMLSPFSEMDMEAREKYQGILDHSYSIFRNSVRENRKLDDDQIEAVSTGEVFTSAKALELGLVDAIGSFDDAFHDLVKTHGLKPKIRGISPRKPFIERLLSSASLESLVERFFRT